MKVLTFVALIGLFACWANAKPTYLDGETVDSLQFYTSDCSQCGMTLFGSIMTKGNLKKQRVGYTPYSFSSKNIHADCIKKSANKNVLFIILEVLNESPIDWKGLGVQIWLICGPATIGHFLSFNRTIRVKSEDW